MHRWCCLLLIGCTQVPERSRAGDADSAALSSANAERQSADTMRSPFETEIWQGEGRPVFEVASSGVRLHASPQSTAPQIGGATLAKGDRLLFDNTRIRTIVPGALRGTGTGTITGRNFGGVRRVAQDAYHSLNVPDTTLRTAPGDSIELLQHRGEGTCFVRVRGVVIEADPCPTFGRGDFRLVREPVLEWWILARHGAGLVGWLLVTDSTARVVDRQF